MGSKLGVLKVAAKRLGLSLEQYQKNIDNGLKWCTVCKQWRPQELFGIDKYRGSGLRAPCFTCSRVHQRKQRRCLAPSKNIQQKAAYTVNRAIKKGYLADPKSLPCINCGNQAENYHHHLGYDRNHWLDVQALCKKCHVRAHW